MLTWFNLIASVYGWKPCWVVQVDMSVHLEYRHLLGHRWRTPGTYYQPGSRTF